MQTNTEIIRKLYSSLNQNDISGVMKLFDPGVLRIEWEGTSSEGVFRGLEEVEAHFRKGRSSWAEGSCRPERMTSIDDKVIVDVFVRVRLKDKTEWNEGRVGDVFILKNGLITEFRSFFSLENALGWVRD